MSKLTDKLSRATAVILVMPGGKQKGLAESERIACIHALNGNWGNWERRCAALYQVLGYIAERFGVFDHDDVTRALDVASGRGDLETLLPWPKKQLETARPEAEEFQETLKRLRSQIPGCDCDNPAQCWEPCGTLGHSERHIQVVRDDDGTS